MGWGWAREAAPGGVDALGITPGFQARRCAQPMPASPSIRPRAAREAQAQPKDQRSISMTFLNVWKIGGAPGMRLRNAIASR